METKQIIEKTEALIDALRATCSLGDQGDRSLISYFERGREFERSWGQVNDRF